ncbi:MAG: UDP-N-acetyl-D-mannosaminuronic acid transferase [Fimbriimonadaceae bacterium]|nr:UDP-N-acetyl-D-mannosaminuronic acid transferase [Fimbriimonadaceae bacterium]
MEHRYILGSRIDATSLDDATRQVLAWARAGESKMVCIANVHMVMEAYDSPSFRELLNESDLNTSDGMPLVWVMRKLGLKNQSRVAGPDLLLPLCRAAAAEGIPVGFHGSTPETLELLQTKLRQDLPSLNIAYSVSPPFRPPTAEEQAETVAAINRSGCGVLFVGLGCPKQEKWMAEHRGKVACPMIGVGAAFDFIAGTVKRAPKWMQKSGLEWLFRLLSDPKRLAVRYFKHNPRYLALAALQVLGIRQFKPSSS